MVRITVGSCQWAAPACSSNLGLFISPSNFLFPFLHHISSNMEIPDRVRNALRALELSVDDHGVVRCASTSRSQPRQWPLFRKVYDTGVIYSLEFFMTVISNTGSSIAPFAASGLGIGSLFAVFCFTTLYLIGQGIGCLVFPPIAESFGGRMIYV